MKCKANIYLCYNYLEAFLQKSVRIYAIEMKFLNLINHDYEKEKIYINIGKKCKKCKDFFQLIMSESFISLHFVSQKCKESVRRSIHEEVLP